MNKKILIGSIVAVIILVLVSFTGVVGFQSVKSDVKASPLFNMRISRAIDRDSTDITFDYVGKGEETNIHLSNRIRREEQIQKVIDIIRKMDDKTFSRFVTRIIINLIYQEQITDKETSDVIQILYLMRKNPNVMKNYDTNNIYVSFLITCVETFKYLTCWESPLCLIKTIYWLFEFIFIWMAATIMPSGCNCATLITGFCCDIL